VALALAALAVFAVFAPGTMARPSPQDLERAKSELDGLNQRLSALVEEYDAAALRVAELERKLSDLKATADKAKATAARSRALLAERAREAYTQGGTRLMVILDSSSFAEFSERMEFLDQLSEDDADLAIRAQVEREAAQRAGTDLAAALDASRAEASRLAARKADIESGVAEQRALVARLERDLQRPVVISPPSASPSDVPIGSLPDASAGAQAAIEAGYSVIGTPYQWGGASPSEGFDCSGFTMWSWAHAGVSLPHSSAAQYSVLPHVAQADLQPGDLLFFYTPIHHVAMYLGNGQMIDSPHTGSYVGIRGVNWDDYVGAGRPGV
jgi:cell wall-associated NlpC family hydrolase